MLFYSRKYLFRNDRFRLNGDEQYPCIVLAQDSRNDHNFQSYFHCFYLESEKNYKKLWHTKIIQQWKYVTTLPSHFESLDAQYFSKSTEEWLYLPLRGAFSESEVDWILKSMNDIYVLWVKLWDIETIGDEKLIEGYKSSLFRYQYIEHSIYSSRKHWVEAIKMISKIFKLSEITDDEFMNQLLFGSLISTLESYLHDTFKDQVLSNEDNILKFITEFWELKSVKLKTIFQPWGGINDQIIKYISDTIDRIMFHNVSKVKIIYQIIWIQLEDIWSFRESVQYRHDIFHRNWKNAAWNQIEITTKDLHWLAGKIDWFIKTTDRSISNLSVWEN